ncbi:hypothetical protein HDV05_000138 [Chytridiales sp. JEL 0842]|nr:hypothetical protein HDV05_000138 [Chytridiales sp. JEL 0842]
MSGGFRNWTSPTSGVPPAEDDDDWRDSEEYKDTQPGRSVADRVSKIGQKIPTAGPAVGAKPAVVQSSIYTAQQQAGENDDIDTSSTSFAANPFLNQNRSQPAPAPVKLPISTGATVHKKPSFSGSSGFAPPPKPAKLHATPAPVASKVDQSAPPSVSSNPFVQASKMNTTVASSVPSVPKPTPSLASSSAPPLNQHRLSDSGSSINTFALAQKFPIFSASEISAFHQQFAAADKDGKGTIHQADLSTVAPKAGEAVQNVISKLSNMKLFDSDGDVSFEAFLTALARLREEKGAVSAASKGKIVLHGQTSENTTHTINEDEKQSFVEHINSVLFNDKDIKQRFPIDSRTMQIFSELKDGLILAKLINDSVPGTIDERVLNIKKINTFQMTENNNVVINSAKAIGCSVINIGAQDLIEGREHLLLGLIWQIIKIGLQAKIDIKYHPELFRLLEPGETLEDFLKLPAEQILLRWFNYHLKKAGWNRKVTNFSSDVKDAENYAVLLAQLRPDTCTRAPLQTRDLLQRAEEVLQNAEKIGCRKYLNAKTLTDGNAKLNFAFVANLFNTYPGLEKLTEAEMAQLDDWLFNSEGSREARAFALWLNSLGVEPFVNNLFDDLQDGLILLQAMDKVRPGLVDWKKVNKAPVSSKFKKVENTNYVIVLGKSLKFTLVGIQGSDITDGQKTLTLGLVWQLMREHVIQTLKSLSKSGVDITEADIISWANGAVKRGGKYSSITQFKDANLRSGIYLLDLLNGIKKGIVNYELVTPGINDDDAKLNAKYAISIARKLGATIFVLPEDIIEVKPKMILTFVGTLMALDRSGALIEA